MFDTLVTIIILSVIILLPFAIVARLSGRSVISQESWVWMLIGFLMTICLFLLPFASAIESWWKGEAIKVADKAVCILFILSYIFVLTILKDEFYSGWIGLCLMISIFLLGYTWMFGLGSFDDPNVLREFLLKRLQEDTYPSWSELTKEITHYGRWH